MTKLGLRAIKSVFLGQVENSNPYRLLDLESNVIIGLRDVEFFDNKCYTGLEIIENNVKIKDINNSNLKKYKQIIMIKKQMILNI